jgi:GTPase SAR1 family protein
MMKNNVNPFITIGYISKEYFCDRENELQILHKYIKNERNITLISARRVGKSALIERFFEDMEQENYICLYVDIYASLSLKELTETLALTVYNKFPQTVTLGKRFLNFLKGLRPVISYDSLNGKPEIHFEYVVQKEYEYTLQNILLFLDNQNIKVILAIDEFQQITNYPEKNTEAVLRTVIQTLNNIRFIFSGSEKTMMLDMFATANRPFFSSTQIISLNEIPTEKYKSFIINKFNEQNRDISEDAVDFILQWTYTHTYYTQIICNGVFAENNKHTTLETVKKVCEQQLNLQHDTFMQYRNLLSSVQWKLLIAIAKEGSVAKIQSQSFLQKYKIGAASSAQKALNALLNKEMICAINTTDKTLYRVYNIFLLRWLERIF